MTFSETGTHTDIPAEQTARECVTTIAKECQDHKKAMAAQYPQVSENDISVRLAATPKPVLDWLREIGADGQPRCPKKFFDTVCGQYLDLAKAKPDRINNYSLDQLLPSLVQNTAKQARIEVKQADNAALNNQETKLNTDNAALNQGLAQDKSEITAKSQERDQVNTTVKVLSNDIAEAAKGKNGPEQLQFAQQLLEQKLAEVNLPEEKKEELRAWLGGIAATLDHMTSLIDDPAEQQAFKTILASNSLNLLGETNFVIFADVMTQVESSTDLSEETKARLQVEGLGVPEFRDSTQMLDTLAKIRTNDGKFLNADGQLVSFNEKNGVPHGRFNIFPDPTDHKEYVAIAQVGGRTLRVHFSPNDEPNYLDELISAAMITHVLADRDLQAANRYILGGDGLAAQGVTEIHLDEFQVKRAERLYGAFMGFGSELRTGFPDQSELRSFEWRLQPTHIDGDAKTNDNTGRGDLSWEKIGMLKNGQINMEKVEEVGAFMNTKSAALPTFDELVERFGEKPDDSEADQNMRDLDEIAKAMDDTFQGSTSMLHPDEVAE